MSDWCCGVRRPRRRRLKDFDKLGLWEGLRPTKSRKALSGEIVLLPPEK